MLAFVADPLGLKGDLFAFYGRREDTRLAPAQHLQADLGLRTATRDDRSMMPTSIVCSGTVG